MTSLNRYVVTDEIYTILKEQIMTHQLAPGEKINIDKLSRELEVSNIPIREVLSRLAIEGLVRNVPFKGMFVMDITRKELDEMYEIRINLEPLAVQKAVPEIPDEHLIALDHSRQIWASFAWADHEQNIAFVTEMNEGVHGLLLRYCDNELLSNLIGSYIKRIQRYLSFIHQELDAELMQAEWREHGEIISSILSRNGQQAAEAMRVHLSQSHQRTRTYFS